MVKSSSAQISSNTLGWPWMTAYLLMSMHVLYIKSKVSKVLGVFSRLRLLICWLRKQQTGYTRWWCCQCLITDIVWRGSGKMNSFKLERMQRRASRIVYMNSSMFIVDITGASCQREETAHLRSGFRLSRRKSSRLFPELFQRGT